MQEMQEKWARSLGREDPLEKEMNPLQYSCLENPMDTGAWQATVLGVVKVKSRKWLCKWAHTRVIPRVLEELLKQVVRAGSRPLDQGPSRWLWALTSGRTLFLCFLEMPLCVLLLTESSPPATGDSILSPVLPMPSCLGVSPHLSDSTPLHWGAWKLRCSLELEEKKITISQPGAPLPSDNRGTLICGRWPLGNKGSSCPWEGVPALGDRNRPSCSNPTVFHLFICAWWALPCAELVNSGSSLAFVRT